jgi:hypothetical protein
MLRNALRFLDTHAAAVQAIGSIVSVVVTVVLAALTAWYVFITNRMLLAVQQERADRINAARAPVSNALTIVEDMLDEAEKTLRRRPVTSADAYQVRNVLGQRMNVLSQATNTLNSVDLARKAAETTSLVQLVAMALPRESHNTRLPQDVLDAAAADAFAKIPAARQAITTLRRDLEHYVG